MVTLRKPASAVDTDNSDPITLRLPEPHEHQRIFIDWEDHFPLAQVLVAPAGTKLGKSLGSSIWLLSQALANQRFYCLWIAPTLLKAKVGYRYMKSMLPDIPIINCVDSRLEIHLGNGSYIKFLHGSDAETVIEGEAVDAFVIDETSKIKKQVWTSLFTTLSQTQGKGIITGTPRGHTWYEEIFKQAKAGDPFFGWAQLTTSMSPYVSPEAIANAKRLLPPHLFDQYYLAKFVTFSTVFGNLDDVWDDKLKVAPGRGYWIHPDPTARALDACTGADWAKINDYTVFTTVASDGRLIGYCRFRGGKYTDQVQRLKNYMAKFTGDMMLDYDKTGVGQAIEDIIIDADIDAAINGVTFTNQTKQDMVTRASIAFATCWFKSPKIAQIESELGALEVKVTSMGHHTYAAPEGEHDDVAWSLLMAISGAYSSSHADKVEQMMADAVDGRLTGASKEDDTIESYLEDATMDDDGDSWQDDEDYDEAELDD